MRTGGRLCTSKTMRTAAFTVVVALLAAGVAAARLQPPVRVTLDGVAGVRPGMPLAEVSDRWGVRLHPSYEVAPDCGPADIRGVAGLEGYAIFRPRDRFGAVFLSRGAITGRGIRIGSSLAQLRRAYPATTSRADRYLHGARQYFVRRTAAPHWELRIDVSAKKRVTRIVFGTHEAVRLDEACA
jgi:hypothetical protein